MSDRSSVYSSEQLEHLASKVGLLGQTIFVVGAGGTIGDACCVELARRGAIVIPSRRGQEGVDQSIALIREAGGSDTSCPGGVVMDLEDQSFASVDSGIERLKKLTCGGADLTGAFFNAGGHKPELIVGKEKHFGDIDRSAVMPFLLTNLIGHCEVLRQLNPLVRETDGFHAVANTSAAMDGLSRVHWYRVAKAGLEQMWKTNALDWGQKYNSRFNIIEPGFVSRPVTDAAAQQNSFAVKDPQRFGAINDHIPLKSDYVDGVPCWASGSEIADPLAVLFSHSMRYANGMCMRVDGGFAVNKLGNTAI